MEFGAKNVVLWKCLYTCKPRVQVRFLMCRSNRPLNCVLLISLQFHTWRGACHTHSKWVSSSFCPLRVSAKSVVLKLFTRMVTFLSRDVWKWPISTLPAVFNGKWPAKFLCVENVKVLWFLPYFYTNRKQRFSASLSNILHLASLSQERTVLLKRETPLSKKSDINNKVLSPRRPEMQASQNNLRFNCCTHAVNKV